MLVVLTVMLAHNPPEASAQQTDEYPEHILSVNFDLNTRVLRGTSTIKAPKDNGIKVFTGGLNILHAGIGGTSIEPDAGQNISVPAGAMLLIQYDLSLSSNKPPIDLENTGIVPGEAISPDGISLTGTWYPQINAMAIYSLTAIMPEGLIPVSEAEGISVIDTPDGTSYSFSFNHPLQGIDLSAGKYDTLSDAVGNVEVYAYFFKEDIGLAREYIDYAKQYISLYTEMIGPFPYKRFSIVENFLPSGYSMPTFTLLGRDVVRLPFIVETSLGHEILHQWFGNYVYVDFNKGNWVEGLTTYLADQYYEALKGEGSVYRKKLLGNYMSYVNDDNEVALKDFTQRSGFATRSIGYGKAAMVFHMLRTHVGEDVFYKALRMLITTKKFQRTSWSDIEGVFSAVYGEDLGWFFSQWTRRKGIPSLSLDNVSVRILEGRTRVNFDLVQDSDEPYKLFVPVRLVTTEGPEAAETFTLEAESASYRLTADSGDPVALIIDGDYDLMRRLSDRELPPTVSRLIGDKSRLVIVPEDEGEREKYSSLIELLKNEGFDTVDESSIKDADLKASSVMVFGWYNSGNPVIDRLFGSGKGIESAMPAPGFHLTILENPLRPDSVVAIVVSSSADETEQAGRKIFRYGSYSRLSFTGGKIVDKEIAETDNGIVSSLSFKVSGIRPAQSMTMDEIILDVMDKTVIYVGESHTNYEDHKVQLEVIRALHNAGKKFAIGMEMFQKPYQEALDDYIAGKTTEKEFLKKSGYYKNWSFDYHLYMEIIDYAKTHSIPIIALNQPTSVVRTISASGTDALTEEQKKDLPADMNMADSRYKERLRDIFNQHRNSEDRDFENFYQAQLVWDETMAHTVNDYLEANPGYQMVVLSGVGHVMYGSGIPRRANRLSGKDYAILINSNIETIDRDIADYIYFPESIKLPEPPMLMVYLDKTDQGLSIKNFSPGSVSESAGMKKGDIIKSIDGLDIEDVDDVKIALFDRTKGDELKVRVLRKRFLLGDDEITLKVKL